MKTIEILKTHLDGIVLQYGRHPGQTREEAAYFYIGPHEEVAPGVWHFYSLANSITFISRITWMPSSLYRNGTVGHISI